jgi:hypothetical protein
MEVFVPKNEHANLDSFPLRFGVHWNSDVTLKLNNAKAVDQWVNKKNGKSEKKIIADFETEHGEQIGVTFILINTGHPNWKVKTVYNSEEREYNQLSDLIKTFRKAELVSSEQLLEYYPRYKTGEFRSPTALYEELIKQVKGTAFEDMERRYKAIIEGDAETIDQLTEENEQLARENTELKEKELKRMEMDKRSAEGEGKVLVLGDNRILNAVRRDIKRGPSFCTEILLSDGSRWYMKTSTFDPDLKITEYAESLVGKSVKLSSWDPVGRPGLFTNQNYFRGIYEVG